VCFPVSRSISFALHPHSLARIPVKLFPRPAPYYLCSGVRPISTDRPCTTKILSLASPSPPPLSPPLPISPLPSCRYFRRMPTTGTTVADMILGGCEDFYIDGDYDHDCADCYRDDSYSIAFTAIPNQSILNIDISDQQGRVLALFRTHESTFRQCFGCFSPSTHGGYNKAGNRNPVLIALDCELVQWEAPRSDNFVRRGPVRYISFGGSHIQSYLYRFLYPSACCRHRNLSP
jgi:hypothetical protein